MSCDSRLSGRDRFASRLARREEVKESSQLGPKSDQGHNLAPQMIEEEHFLDLESGEATLMRGDQSHIHSDWYSQTAALPPRQHDSDRP